MSELELVVSGSVPAATEIGRQRPKDYDPRTMLSRYGAWEYEDYREAK